MNVDTKTILYMVADRFGLKRDCTEDRLRLQKVIYLLQAHGMRLGYGFSWYRYGPYSQDLVFDAYAVLGSEKDKFKKRTRSLKFSPNSEQKFTEFEATCASILNETRQLELVASVDFVRRTWYPEARQDELVDHFKNHKRRLFDGQPVTDGMIREAVHVCNKLRAEQG